MMVDLENQAKRFETDVRTGWVTAVDFSGDKKLVEIEEGKHVVSADSVIVSTGASAKWLGLESETRLRLNGGGVSACAVCDGFFYRGQEVAVVGAGDSACEGELPRQALHQGPHARSPRPDARLQGDAAPRHGHGQHRNPLEHRDRRHPRRGAGGRRQGPQQPDRRGDRSARHGLLPGHGHKPNTDIFAGQVDLDEKATSSPRAPFVLHQCGGRLWSGDACDKTYRQAITAAGTGCMAALDAERYLAEKGIH